VTNQLFEDRTAWWDVLCNIDTGKITVSKDITPVAPSSHSSGHYDDTRAVPLFSNGATTQSSGKHDNGDNEFMADVKHTFAGFFLCAITAIELVILINLIIFSLYLMFMSTLA
jgi:hypothetical protein